MHKILQCLGLTLKTIDLAKIIQNIRQKTKSSKEDIIKYPTQTQNNSKCNFNY